MEETTCGELRWGYWGPGPPLSGSHGGISALLFDRTVGTDSISELEKIVRYAESAGFIDDVRTCESLLRAVKFRQKIDQFVHESRGLERTKAMCLNFNFHRYVEPMRKHGNVFR